ncbi:MAG: hypothetical protein WDK95_15845, partial [Syntrophorhabdaceae bacterium]
KYYLNPTDRETPQQFMQKLNEKGQSADKQKQAYQSVKVYLDIVANEKKQDDNQKFRDGNEVKTLNVASSDTASPAIFFRQTMTSELFRFCAPFNCIGVAL